ncbi:rhamnogalacturonan acetylesterase [Pseudarthrobacter equi]|uniref:rhamnogalacturonan acetylesterase n=1 Tax=Pseudarthrobacter equi TaxID=728066 RepID=UPI0021BEE681|nr:rhamnogalacturonan acetylesterase [Pseudarthrobacter equi]MCT9626755.1 rhamnogalacturonan acetylesterase [Pseudarthrobacter equi]
MAIETPVTRRSALIALGTASLSLAAATSALAGTPDEPVVKTIFLASDSTAAQKYQDVAPETGWGMALPYYLTPHVAVRNHAMNGRSSKSFIDEGRLDAILAAIRPSDVLVIQFAHNDQKSQDPSLYTEPWTTYQDYLRLYVDGARAKGAVPVLVTPAERRRFDRNGDAYTSHGEYPAAVRALAAEKGVPLIDVQSQTLALWQSLGLEETKKYFLYTADGRRDNTHFNPPGAAAIARMVATGLLGSSVLEPGFVRRLDGDVPPSWFTWPTTTLDHLPAP